MTKQKYEPGVYQISNEEYHAAEGISRSALWTFKQLPQKYWYEYVSGKYKRPKETEAFVIGDMVHTLLLEPQMFDERYYMRPELEKLPPEVRMKDVGKEQFEQVKSARKAVQDRNNAIIEEYGSPEGRSIISANQFELVRAMVDSLESQEIVRQIVSKQARVEQSIFWIDEETGVLCKARPDVWNNPLCGDLKTTESASYRDFQYSAMKYGYFVQAAMIYEALKSIGEAYDKFIFMCVEKKLPHAVGLYLLDDEALQFGLDLFHQLLRQYAECHHTGIYPDYGVQMLMIPKYATMELINE